VPLHHFKVAKKNAVIVSPICKLLVLRYLENEHVRELQFDALRWGMTRGA
jgi:hypothetical protein